MKTYSVTYLTPEVIEVEAEDVKSAINIAYSILGHVEIADVYEIT